MKMYLLLVMYLETCVDDIASMKLKYEKTDDLEEENMAICCEIENIL